MSQSIVCNPVLARVIRGGEVECVHRGSAVVVDADGLVSFSVGDTGRHIFPRSSYKFLQAIALLESGAADAFGLGEREIALACASHSGEPMHTDRVSAWLENLGLDDGDLECGASLPMHVATARQMLRQGRTTERKHHNCSGKHVGMLTLARHLDAPTAGYSDYEHPVQRAWRKVLSELTGVDSENLVWERDGCGLPALCMPMQALARGYARFADTSGLARPRVEAMNRILSAVKKHPDLIAGSDRCCSAVIEKTGGRVLVKTGAEGVFAGTVPERGIGFALKIDDGATRGSEVALGGLLGALGLLRDGEKEALRPWFRPDVLNSQNYVTGWIEASDEWKPRQ
jgi:L-asparaginase II